VTGPHSTFDLPTPALVIDADALDRNLATMAAAHPGPRLRPHVKAHKCTALAAAQVAHGHLAFTCATPREVLGMAAAGIGHDLLLANEVLDPSRLAALGAAQSEAAITVAIDSDETLGAASVAGIRSVLIDVDVGLPRCGCAPTAAGALADRARARGMEVRGVMGYEGHLMVVTDRADQRERVAHAMDLLLLAHADVGGDIVSAGGTGTYDLHDRVSEVQAGSYALMDTHYAQLGLPFGQACFVIGTVISATAERAVADVGLKALGMDHGNPAIEAARVWFCSDEHVTFARVDAAQPRPGDRVRVIPAHIDPTMAMHETAWIVRGDEVVDRWPIDLRGW
jgi:D-threonine aldolase